MLELAEVLLGRWEVDKKSAQYQREKSAKLVCKTICPNVFWGGWGGKSNGSEVKALKVKILRGRPRCHFSHIIRTASTTMLASRRIVIMPAEKSIVFNEFWGANKAIFYMGAF